MDLDSGLLRAFVAVCDEQHFGRAAARLQVSQQGLSKRVARLESRVGVRLFDRGTRRVALTDAATRLLPHARAAVDAVDAAVAVVAPAQRLVRLDVLSEHLAPMHVVRGFQNPRPGPHGDIELVVVCREGHRTAPEMLRSGACDICFGRGCAVVQPWPKDVKRRLVLPEPLELLLPRSHRWASRDEVTMTELAHEQLWFPMAGAPSEWTDLLDELAARFGLSIDYEGSTMGFQHWVERIALGTAPPSFIGAAMPTPPVPDLTRVPLVDPTPVYPWWAMWQGRTPESLVDEVTSPLEAIGRGELALVGDPDQRWLPERDRALLPAGRTAAAPHRGKATNPESSGRDRRTAAALPRARSGPCRG